MKISFVTTVLNEAESIEALLYSLENQSQKPDEVIIIDGGSTDSTVAKIKSFHKKSRLEIKCLVKKSNRSRGRNLGIGQATGEGIVVTDGGCTPYPDWLEKISQPIRGKKADVVAGWYEMRTDTIFTRCSAPFFGPMSHNLNKKTFLPASRSIAFTKKAWAKVGGYPESLDFAAEDIVFAQNLKDNPGLKMVFRQSAVVEWTPAQNLQIFFHDIKNHTRGNIQAGYTRHLKKNALVAIRYAVGVSLLLAAIISLNPSIVMSVIFLAVLYFIYPSIKFAPLVKHPIYVVYFGFLQLTADLAVISALFEGGRH
ncbi:MAG: glycosyltransferase [Candidatus Chisholmbacteria bacterium]|nr:glycosyltransferase [Candidatus Chisholmbacteria bacterium]